MNVIKQAEILPFAIPEGAIEYVIYIKHGSEWIPDLVTKNRIEANTEMLTLEIENQNLKCDAPGTPLIQFKLEKHFISKNGIKRR